MMDFTQDDRDMLKAHDIKLATLCITTNDMNKLLKGIDKKITGNDVICVEKRSACRKEIDVELKKFFTKRVLMFIIAGIAIAIMSLATLTGTLSREVSVNTQRIVDFHHGELK